MKQLYSEIKYELTVTALSLILEMTSTHVVLRTNCNLNIT